MATVARVVVDEAFLGIAVAAAVGRHHPPTFIVEEPVPGIAPVDIGIGVGVVVPTDPVPQPVVGVLANRGGRTAAGLHRVATFPRPTGGVLLVRPHTHDLRERSKFAGTTICSTERRCWEGWYPGGDRGGCAWPEPCQPSPLPPPSGRGGRGGVTPGYERSAFRAEAGGAEVVDCGRGPANLRPIHPAWEDRFEAPCRRWPPHARHEPHPAAERARPAPRFSRRPTTIPALPDAPDQQPEVNPEDDPADVAAVAAIKRGDSSAWGGLIQRHQDRIYSTCVRMVHDRELATDLAQDSFVKIIKGIESFDGRARLTTWMTRIAMNVCLSKLRSEKLRRHASLEAMSDARSGMTGDSGGGGGRGMELEQSREPQQSLGVEAHEDRERVLAALRHLDPDQRAVLILCDCQGNSYEQIADVLGVAVGTVKSRLFRARAALRDAVERLPQDRGRKGAPSSFR